MIELLLEQAGDPRHEQDLLRELSAHVAAVKATARSGDRRQVGRMEAAVQSNPEASFRFDDAGFATLHAAAETYAAGRFETPSIGALRRRALAARAGGTGGHVRLW